MFHDRSDLLCNNPTQLSYGAAVTDIDGDGAFEIFVTGFGGPNRLLKWSPGEGFVDMDLPALADPQRSSIGVAAADIDGDGREEIYVLNTDTFAGPKSLPDRLFAYGDDGWLDLFSLPENIASINLTAGRSVACVDRSGRGQYGFFIANYGGPMRLYELDEDGRITDVAPEAGLNLAANGRSLISCPIVSQYMDIFVGNELGANFLFRNRGDGGFDEIASDLGIADALENVRGVAAIDSSGNGSFAIVYGNWEGPHRLFVRSSDGIWDDIAPPGMARPSRIRTLIAADFDNDGYEELFFNNIGEPNSLFAQRNGDWVKVDIGAAAEPDGLGTGAVVGDFDGDGRLELLISHGESGAQPMSLYQVANMGNHYLRVLPLTRYGGPARGATVTLITSTRTQRRFIDAGSGYLCQMEPVAHFGLGKVQAVQAVEVRWPDGSQTRIENPAVDQLIRVPFPA